MFPAVILTFIRRTLTFCPTFYQLNQKHKSLLATTSNYLLSVPINQFQDQPNGPFVIRDIKFPDGDCTSDSFLWSLRRPLFPQINLFFMVLVPSPLPHSRPIVAHSPLAQAALCSSSRRSRLPWLRITNCARRKDDRSAEQLLLLPTPAVCINFFPVPVCLVSVSSWSNTHIYDKDPEVVWVSIWHVYQGQSVCKE